MALLQPRQKPSFVKRPVVLFHIGFFCVDNGGDQALCIRVGNARFLKTLESLIGDDGRTG